MRSKPKKKPNRYNPNSPSFLQVHSPYLYGLLTGVFPSQPLTRGYLYYAITGVFHKMGRR